MSHSKSEFELAVEDVFFLSTGETVFGGRLVHGGKLKRGIYEIELPGQEPLTFQGEPKMPGRRPDMHAVGTFDKLALPDDIKALIAAQQIVVRPGSGRQ